MLGQSVFSKAIGNNSAQVNLSALPAGNYVVKAQTEGAVQTFKIIKQ